MCLLSTFIRIHIEMDLQPKFAALYVVKHKFFWFLFCKSYCLQSIKQSREDGLVKRLLLVSYRIVVDFPKERRC